MCTALLDRRLNRATQKRVLDFCSKSERRAKVMASPGFQKLSLALVHELLVAITPGAEPIKLASDQPDKNSKKRPRDESDSEFEEKTATAAESLQLSQSQEKKLKSSQAASHDVIATSSASSSASGSASTDGGLDSAM